MQTSSPKHRNSKNKSKQGATWGYILVDSTETPRLEVLGNRSRHRTSSSREEGDMVPENNAASWHQDMHPRRPRLPCPPTPFNPRHCPRKQKIRLYTPQKIGRIKRHPLLRCVLSQCAPVTKRYTKRFLFFCLVLLVFAFSGSLACEKQRHTAPDSSTCRTGRFVDMQVKASASWQPGEGNRLPFWRVCCWQLTASVRGRFPRQEIFA